MSAAFCLTVAIQRQVSLLDGAERPGRSPVRPAIKHTFGRRLRAAEVSFEDRQDLLGHCSGRMTTHYSAAELSRLIEAANRVCDGTDGQPELVVLRGGHRLADFAKLPQGQSRRAGELSKPRKSLVPRGGIEPPTP